MDSATKIQLLKERLNSDPSDFEAAEGLGNLFFDEKNPAASIMYYLIALNIKPDQPSILTDMGTMLMENGDISLAEQSFRRSIELDSSFGNAYVNLGVLLYHARHQTKEAREVWSQLIQQHPNHAATKYAENLLSQTKT